MSEQKTTKRRRSRGHGGTEQKNEEKKPKEALSREEKKKRRQRQVWIERIVVGVLLVTILTGLGICLKILLSSKTMNVVQYNSQTGQGGQVAEPDIDVQLLTINEYSRPGLATDTIRGVVIHYTANPGSTAQQNRDYFENLKDTHDTKASSNFIVGIEGEIIQCVPTSEIAYASNSRNSDTVSIECCHPDDTGKFTEATYNSAVQLTAFLCSKFGLTEEAVIRHYDVTGKDCPKYYVAHEDEWEAFKADVGAVLRAAS